MKGLLMLLLIAVLLFLLWDGGQNYESAMGGTPETETEVRNILTTCFGLAVIIIPLAYVMGNARGTR